ncbi:MFS transporter [Streptomyces sp. MT29]|nr:MFS transporter [Streptomyces sp. MT29]
MICLVAPNLGVLVAGRFVQAAGSGAMAACAMALTASVPPERRAQVFAGFGATMAIFSASATLAGGVFTEWVTWRIALVLPALSLLVVPLCLAGAPARKNSGRSMDLPGAALLTLTAMSFLVLIQSSALALSTPLVTATAVVLLLSGAGLIWRTRSSETSFVPRALVTDGVFLKAAVIGIGVYGGLFAAMYAVPQLLVRDHGWSVLAVGVWLLPGAVVGAILSRLAGRLTAGDHGNLLLGAVSLAFGGGARRCAGRLRRRAADPRCLARLLRLLRHPGVHHRPDVRTHRTGPARRCDGAAQPHLLRGRRCRQRHRRGAGEVDVALHGARRRRALPADRRTGRLHPVPAHALALSAARPHRTARTEPPRRCCAGGRVPRHAGDTSPIGLASTMDPVPPLPRDQESGRPS